MRITTPRMLARIAALVLAVVVLDACGSVARSTTRRDPSIMDTTDLRRDNYSTLYDAISAQHADWLLPRGGPTGNRSPELGVWVEGAIRSQGVAYLRMLRPSDVKQVRRLTTTESLHTYSWPWGGLVITPRF